MCYKQEYEEQHYTSRQYSKSYERTLSASLEVTDVILASEYCRRDKSGNREEERADGVPRISRIVKGCVEDDFMGGSFLHVFGYRFAGLTNRDGFNGFVLFSYRLVFLDFLLVAVDVVVVTDANHFRLVDTVVVYGRIVGEEVKRTLFFSSAGSGIGIAEIRERV